jgi:hypothetical protein
VRETISPKKKVAMRLRCASHSILPSLHTRCVHILYQYKCCVSESPGWRSLLFQMKKKCKRRGTLPSNLHLHRIRFDAHRFKVRTFRLCRSGSILHCTSVAFDPTRESLDALKQAITMAWNGFRSDMFSEDGGHIPAF